MKPTHWLGRFFSFGLYKSGKLLATQQNVGIGSQAVFKLTPKLYFGVVSNVNVGDTFKSLTTTQNYVEVDLSNFENGLKITLHRNPANGEFTFTTAQPWSQEISML